MRPGVTEIWTFCLQVRRSKAWAVTGVETLRKAHAAGRRLLATGAAVTCPRSLASRDPEPSSDWLRSNGRRPGRASLFPEFGAQEPPRLSRRCPPLGSGWSCRS
jgi:hypothetical protein